MPSSSTRGQRSTCNIDLYGCTETWGFWSSYGHCELLIVSPICKWALIIIIPQRCGQSPCGVPVKWVRLSFTSDDRTVLFQRYVCWLTQCHAFKKLEKIKDIAPKIISDKAKRTETLRQIEEAIGSQQLNPHSRRRLSSPGPSRRCGSSPGLGGHCEPSSPAPGPDKREIKSSPLKRARSCSVISISDDDERPPKKSHVQDMSDEEVILADGFSNPRQPRKGKRRVKPDSTLNFLGDDSTIVADDDLIVRPLVRPSLLCTDRLTLLNF